MDEKRDTCDEVKKPMQMIGRERTAKDVLRSTIDQCHRMAAHFETIQKMLPTELDAAQNAALLEILHRLNRYIA